MTKYPLDVMRKTTSCLLEVWRAQVGCLLGPHVNHTVPPACSTWLLQAFLPWSRGNFSPSLSHGPASPEPGAGGGDTHLEFGLVGASFCVSWVLIQGRLSMLELNFHKGKSNVLLPRKSCLCISRREITWQSDLHHIQRQK